MKPYPWVCLTFLRQKITSSDPFPPLHKYKKNIDQTLIMKKNNRPYQSNASSLRIWDHRKIVLIYICMFSFLCYYHMQYIAYCATCIFVAPFPFYFINMI